MHCKILFLNLAMPFLILGSTKQPKIVGLVAAHNEAPMIQLCLTVLSYYVDAIVFLDDASDDTTVAKVEAIAKNCKVKKILKKEKWFRDEPGDKNKLLTAGRSIGGTHFIFLDADEILSANCLENNWLRSTILSLAPGEKLVLRLIDLWKSPYFYRIDHFPYANRILDCAFHDDGMCYYDSEFIHTSHSPQHRIAGERFIRDNHVVLHFAFVNWQDVLIKFAWYKCLERVRLPQKSILQINREYASGTDETGAVLQAIDGAWVENYGFFDPSVFQSNSSWRIKQIKAWFQEFGKDYFADLHIWNIDWDSL